MKKLLIIMVVSALIYAVLLQLTNQHQAAEDFVKWAGGGLMTVTILAWFLGGL